MRGVSSVRQGNGRAVETLINGKRFRWCNKHQGFWPLHDFRKAKRCSRGFSNECRPCCNGRKAVERARSA